MPQCSVLGALQFNTLTSKLFLFNKKASFHHYADDNTLSAYLSDLNSLTDVLIGESQITIKCFSESNTIMGLNNVCIKEKKHHI